MALSNLLKFLRIVSIIEILEDFLHEDQSPGKKKPLYVYISVLIPVFFLRFIQIIIHLVFLCFPIHRI